ncbi:MAG: hypothetical protein WCL27_06710 [Betaproteobacteria bacterium]
MISEKAKQGLDLIFTRAARVCLATEASDSVAIEPIYGARTIAAPQEHILVLTIASYVFRLLIFFHLDKDENTKNYFTRCNPDLRLNDVIGEFGNLCCGAINRDLGHHFPHTGMSTPTLLKNQCIPHLPELNPSYISRHEIVINHSVRMQATLCFCAYSTIDFSADATTIQEVSGELELF